jgi:GT2 family glycosyltransferase
MDNTEIKGLVSLVLLNWNGEKYVYDCVSSIMKQTYNKYEIIIVDNNSTDNSCKKLLELYESKDNIKFIINKENTGFSKGMNIGIDACQGEFMVLLNNDIYLKENFIENFVKKFEEDKDISCIQGTAYNWTKGELTDILQTGALFLKKRLQGTYINSDKEIYSFGPHGSFPIIRKKALLDVINKCGYAYDEDFGTGWEDTDLWFRFQLFGYKTLYMPSVIAWHVGSASADEQIKLIDKSIEYQARVLRNRYYIIGKNYTNNMLKKYNFCLKFTEMLLIPYYILVSPSTLKALKMAKKMYKTNINSTMGKREIIQNNISVDYDYMKQFFIKF